MRSRKIQEVQSSPVHDIVCNVNYILKYGTFIFNEIRESDRYTTFRDIVILYTMQISLCNSFESLQQIVFNKQYFIAVCNRQRLKQFYNSCTSFATYINYNSFAIENNRKSILLKEIMFIK